MDYLIAWVTVAAAGLATVAGIFLLTHAISWIWLRSLIRCLSAVWLLIPAKIVVVKGYYAPAYIVAIFEGWFRHGGDPGPALATLGLASAAALLVFLVVPLVKRLRQPS